MNKNNFMKAMSMIDEELMHEADTPYTPEAAGDTSNEIYRENDESDSVSGVDVYHGFLWKKVLAAATTVMIAAGAVGGGAYYYSRLKENNNINNINDNSMVKEDVETDVVTQPSTGTQTTKTQTITTQTTANEHITITQTYADTETTVQDTTPLSNIVRYESINLPDGIESFLNSERAADGFSYIVYYGEQGDRDMAYLHISEDMQTIEMSVLTPPDDKSVYDFFYRGSAFEEDGIWVIVSKESKDRNEGENVQYLLCHYAEDGTLLSTVPAKDIWVNTYTYLNNEGFNCVGDMLYMTLSDGKILQIDKETAEDSVITDLGIDYDHANSLRDYKFLCFDRDDKPVLLQEKVYSVPDKSEIKEAVVYEFDLASGSCGQTLYSIGEDLNKISFLKGCGEYRFFINTYNELIGIKDDGTQEVLIDIKASDLETQIMNPDDYPVPYTNNLFDINIIPADDTRFLGLYMHYPEYRTEAFRFTRKHESELN